MSKLRLLAVPMLLVGALALIGQTPQKKSFLDKATLEAYVRHLFVMDARIKVEVGEVKPSSELPGFSDVSVHASMGNQSQNFQFLVSKDGSKILQGNVYDVNQNPFKKNLDLLKNEGNPGLGTSGAPVSMVVFSDFQCPYCKAEAQMLRENLISTYPTQVKLYFKNWPIESLHPWAKAAAIAGRCVANQSENAFWQYHDYMFGHQSEITPENLKDKVLEWGKGQKDLDTFKLGSCIDSKATLPDVEKTLAEGRALGVSGTPTLFVNGRKIDNTIEWANLKAIIDFEIEYQKTAKNAGDDCGCSVELPLPGMTSKKK